MSKVTINGITIVNTNDTPAASQAVISQPTVVPSFATHRLIDGHWVAKGSATPAPATQPRPIGFIQPTAAPITSSVVVDGVRQFTSRAEALRAIELAAAKVLLAGTDRQALDMIHRGRLGGRKDNLSELSWLANRYQKSI